MEDFYQNGYWRGFQHTYSYQSVLSGIAPLKNLLHDLTKKEFAVMIQLFCKPAWFVVVNRFLWWFSRFAASSRNHPGHHAFKDFSE